MFGGRGGGKGAPQCLPCIMCKAAGAYSQTLQGQFPVTWHWADVYQHLFVASYLQAPGVVLLRGEARRGGGGGSGRAVSAVAITSLGSRSFMLDDGLMQTNAGILGLM